jgi:hypothetical protein
LENLEAPFTDLKGVSLLKFIVANQKLPSSERVSLLPLRVYMSSKTSAGMNNVMVTIKCEKEYAFSKEKKK